MDKNKEKFDLIFSLGGSCACAHNLRYRNMRKVALPFDWLFMQDNYPIKILSECFENNFEGFLLKKNLEELQGDERGTDHNNKLQYKDTYTEYRWINHFENPIEIPGYYQKVKAITDKRIKRLQELIGKSDKTLCLLDTKFEVDLENIKNLKLILEKNFPNANFKFIILEFLSNVDETCILPDITIYKMKRNTNLDDYTKTTSEWDFLDSIELTDKLFCEKPYTMILKKIIKLIILIIPIKKLRKKLRGKMEENV